MLYFTKLVQTSNVSIHYSYAVQSPNISNHPFTLYPSTSYNIWCEQSMQHIKTCLWLIPLIFFPSQDKLSSWRFWMVTEWYKSQIMAHYKWHLCFKTVFCQHWRDKKVSTSANTLHLMSHILKSAWRTCPSPPIKHWVATTSTMHKTKRKTSSKMALFLHVT